MTTCRRFTLLDAMILVAATAAGLAGMRLYYPEFLTEARYRPDPHGWAISVILWVEASLPLFLAWTLAFLVLRFRRPRPPIRRVLRQPGPAAVSAVALTFASGTMTFAGVAALRMHLYQGYFDNWLYSELASLKNLVPFCCGPAVASAWMVLVLGCRWRSEPSWIDRFGRFLGWFWIVLTPFHLWIYLGL